MNCKNCKKDIGQNTKFCPNCGEKNEGNYKPNFVLLGQPQKISFWNKIKKLGWFYWVLIGVMAFSIILNILFDVRWVLYLLVVAATTLFIYGSYIREKELSPEESAAESKAILYPFWKKQAEREGKTIDPKEAEFYKKEHAKFNTKNTLTVIMPLAVFVTLRQELSVPLAIFISLLVGGVIRFSHSFFENEQFKKS